MEKPDIPISKQVQYNSNRIIYELETTHGILEAIFDPTTHWLGISNFDVEQDYKRQGIGKALLREALELAKEQDARFIHALIISRECLDAMRIVFGENALEVIEEGHYSSQGQEVQDTRANLWFEVER